MLTTTTAPPANVIQSGARVASDPAITSHASVNAKVAITRRASWEAAWRSSNPRACSLAIVERVPAGCSDLVPSGSAVFTIQDIG